MDISMFDNDTDRQLLKQGVDNLMGRYLETGATKFGPVTTVEQYFNEEEGKKYRVSDGTTFVVFSPSEFDKLSGNTAGESSDGTPWEVNILEKYEFRADDGQWVPVMTYQSGGSVSEVELKNIDAAGTKRSAKPSLIGLDIHKKIIADATKEINKKGLTKYLRKQHTFGYIPKDIYLALSPEEKSMVHSHGYLYVKDDIVVTSEGMARLESIAKSWQKPVPQTPVTDLTGFKIVKDTHSPGTSVLYHLIDPSGNVVTTALEYMEMATKVNKINKANTPEGQPVYIVKEDQFRTLPVFWYKKSGEVIQENHDGGEISATRVGMAYDPEIPVITDVANNLSSGPGNLFQRYGLSIITHYPTFAQALDHKEKVESHGIPIYIIEDENNHNFYVFSKQERKLANGGDIEDLKGAIKFLEKSGKGYSITARFLGGWNIEQYGAKVGKFSDKELIKFAEEKGYNEPEPAVMEIGGRMEVDTPEDFQKWAAGRDIELIDELGGFRVGDSVKYTNEFGVSFEPITIVGIDKSDKFYNRRFYLNKDSYWFPVKLEEISHSKLKDTSLIKKRLTFNAPTDVRRIDNFKEEKDFFKKGEGIIARSVKEYEDIIMAKSASDSNVEYYIPKGSVTITDYEGKVMATGGSMESTLPASYYKQFLLKGNAKRFYNIFQTHGDSELRYAAKQLFPGMSKEEHKRLAAQYEELANTVQGEYSKAVDETFMQNLGRLPEPGDYKVSGVWRDDFPEAAKNRMRDLLAKESAYKAAFYVHKAASKYADGGSLATGQQVLDKYRDDLEKMDNNALASAYSAEKGVDVDEVLSDIEDEREYYIDELVFSYWTMLRSRGELQDGGELFDNDGPKGALIFQASSADGKYRVSGYKTNDGNYSVSVNRDGDIKNHPLKSREALELAINSIFDGDLKDDGIEYLVGLNTENFQILPINKKEFLSFPLDMKRKLGHTLTDAESNRLEANDIKKFANKNEIIIGLAPYQQIKAEIEQASGKTYSEGAMRLAFDEMKHTEDLQRAFAYLKHVGSEVYGPTEKGYIITHRGEQLEPFSAERLIDFANDLIKENEDEVTPRKIDITAKEIKRKDDTYKLGLVTEDHIFFINPEETDDNGNTMIFDKKGNLLSDNYFATNALFEDLINEKGEVKYIYIDPELEKYLPEIRKDSNIMAAGGHIKKALKKENQDWLFIAGHENATVYTDKTKQTKGDYHEIAAVYYNPLELKIFDKSPKYASVIAMAEKEWNERQGIVQEASVSENTPDNAQSHILRYKGFIIIRDEHSHTQGSLKIYKDNKLIETYSSELSIPYGKEYPKDNRENMFKMTDGEVRSLIDRIESDPMVNMDKGGQFKVGDPVWVWDKNAAFEAHIEDLSYLGDKRYPKYKNLIGVTYKHSGQREYVDKNKIQQMTTGGEIDYGNHYIVSTEKISDHYDPREVHYVWNEKDIPSDSSVRKEAEKVVNVWLKDIKRIPKVDFEREVAKYNRPVYHIYKDGGNMQTSGKINVDKMKPLEFFGALDITKLGNDKVVMYLKEQVLHDPNLSLIEAHDEEFMEIKALIASKYPEAMPGYVAPTPVKVPEPVVIPEPVVVEVKPVSLAVLKARLKLVKQMSEDNPKNPIYKARIKLIQAMLTEKMDEGGSMTKES